MIDLTASPDPDAAISVDSEVELVETVANSPIDLVQISSEVAEVCEVVHEGAGYKPVSRQASGLAGRMALMAVIFNSTKVNHPSLLEEAEFKLSRAGLNVGCGGQASAMFHAWQGSQHSELKDGSSKPESCTIPPVNELARRHEGDKRQYIIYLHDDATDPAPLLKTLVELVDGSVLLLTHEDVIHANDYYNWDGALANTNKLIMSKAAFTSSIYHGLLKIQARTSPNFASVETALKEVGVPPRSMPLIFGLASEGSPYAAQFEPKVTFLSLPGLRPRGDATIDLQGLDWGGFVDLAPISAMAHYLLDVLGAWAASLYLVDELNNLKATVHTQRTALTEERYSRVLRQAEESLAKAGSNLELSPDPIGAYLRCTPFYPVWESFKAQLQPLEGARQAVLVTHPTVAKYLHLTLLKLKPPQLAVTLASAWEPRRLTKGQHLIVGTFKDIDLINQLRCAVYFFEAFPSVPHYLWLRKRLVSSCAMVVLVETLDPMAPYLKALELELADQIRHVTPEGAVLTYASAKLFLTEYSQSGANASASAHFGYAVTPKDDRFTCKFSFPPSLRLASFTGPSHPTKRLAKRAAAWEACYRLLGTGDLDGRLLPSRANKSTLVAINADASPINKATFWCSTKVPDVWADVPDHPTHLYLNVVDMHLLGYRPFAIVTHAPLPNLLPIPLRFEGFYADATFRPEVKPISISSPELSLLTGYTIYAFTLALRKVLIVEAGLPYYFVPLDGAAIDWACLARLGELSSDRRWWSGSLCHDLGFQLYQLPELEEPLDPSQPLLAKRLNLQTNYINVDFDQVGSKEQAPETYEIHPRQHQLVAMPLDVLRSAYLLPSLMKRLQDNLLALEVKAILGLTRLREDLLLEALTLEEAQLPLSMKRLEFLGDTFLNLMVSFIPLLNREEVAIISNYHASNRCLFDLACDLGIPAHLIGRPLTPSWVPSIAKSGGGEAFPCNRKRVADAMEAILGAALLSGGEALGLRCLISFGLWPERVDAWSLILQNLISTLPPKLMVLGEGLDLQALEAQIGYQFSDAVDGATLLLSDFQNGPPCMADLGGLLFKFVATRHLVGQLPAMPPSYLCQLLAHFACPNFYHQSNAANLTALILEVAERCGVGLQLSHLQALHRVLRAVFVDAGLYLPRLYAIFNALYSPLLMDHLYTLDLNLNSLKVVVLRLFYLARCCGLGINFCHYSQVMNSSLCQVSIHTQLVTVGRAGTQSGALKKALAGLLVLNAEPDFIRSRCTCRGPRPPSSPWMRWPHCLPVRAPPHSV
ncbi:Dicer-like protein 1 [Massospora cicadina]|nr:Dicer-like protein 1 [Massospora cicadina]